MSAHARLRSFEIFSLFILFLLVSFIIYYTINSAVTADSPLELAGSQLKSAIKPKVILVTGAAGFIGHALSLELIKEHPDNVVIGVDDFNDYYDVRLKMDRAYDLHKHDIVIYNEDICNIDFLEELFSLYNFTNVAHLAAQAGVRYSLKNPQAYIHSNVECQLALMNLLKTQPGIKMIYASSSSIYGKESTIPFRLSAYTDRPGNMYAATKKTDELIAYHYCKSYKLTSVGLRFFTVYGPWGRPDMAVYMFAEAIVEGTSVPMFHVSDDNPLGRDFTYIDDIITGVMAAINYTPGQCGEKYNLGYGNPVSVPKLIEYLQEELGIEADIQKLPLPSTEILRTWADIETSTAILGFRPVIDLKEGVRQFVEWYKNYRIKRHIEENSADTPQRDIWFASIFNERIERHGRYQENYDNKKDDRRRKDVQFERSRFKKWFHTYNVPVPEVKKTSFVLYPDYDSEGGNIIHLSDLKDNMKELQRICEELEDCVAFSTSGHLKHRLQPKSQWLKHTPGVINLYVADIDICSVELDSCSVHSTCTSLGSAQYSCSCHPGYSGDGVQCLPMRGEVSDVELDHIADMYGVYNISAMKSTADMFFFKGVDSPGGDYMLVKDAENRLEELPFICKEDPLCIGITTAGVMKKRIAAQSMWISTGDTSKNHGIYVFDVNYCLLSDHGCPHHSSCARLGPASYQCVCNDNCITSNEACWVKPPISSFLYNDVKDQHGSESGHVAEYIDETLSNENERFRPLLVDIKPL